MNLAPIVLFTYNRPWHLRQTVEALQKNELAADSELLIFSDGPKTDSDIYKVEEVRKYIKTIDSFKDITIVERDKNWGLADNIIDGVTKVVNQYGKIIVLEDDLVTSPYFLRFMNDALEFYKDEKKVWHISGWNYPIDTEGLDDVFLWRLMNCWGWATWANRWKHYEKNIDRTIASFSRQDIHKFNLDGTHDFWSQVIANKRRKINTWAIFWYVTIFKNRGLCLNPSQTFIKNIGCDGSGAHCSKLYSYSCQLSQKSKFNFTANIIEDPIAVERIKNFHKSQRSSLIVRAMHKIKGFVNAY